MFRNIHEFPFLACNITKNLDVYDYNFVHLTLTLLLHYLVKCRSVILAVYNSECILVTHASAENIFAIPQNHRKSTVTQLTTSCGVCYHTKISNVNELKRSIDSEWTALRHAVTQVASASIMRLRS